MKTFLICSIALLICTTPVFAADLRMICSNPHQKYLLTFDSTSRSLVINPDTDKTAYQTLAFEQNQTREVVSGVVGLGSGLAFRAEFRPAAKVEFFDGSKLTQTDACRDVAR